MQLTDETPVSDLLAWLEKNKVTARTFREGCPCCGDNIPDERIVVALYEAGTPLIISGGAGATLTQAYADAITRYEDVLGSDEADKGSDS